MPRITAWQKSSFSGPDDGQHCVELAGRGKVILIRESDKPGVVIRTNSRMFGALLKCLSVGTLLKES
ncbi:DUF397 domain-containing protein [Streptomyces orinoci]|uniref:DUF397 domain-containing protein n=1 Tax=Streptomyces orinoci TaxID=67339 RepID=A0ABV3JWC6_STRON|nr:DUF397 domain-containing protein [Streptomyces orinoci]